MTDLAISFADIEAAAARLAGVAHRTPVLTSRTADARTGAQLFFKCENLQRMGAFKFRGGYNALAKFTPAQRRRVMRHHDGRLAAMQLRGERHGLRMVARGERDDAIRTLRIGQRIHRVVATAELERAHALQVLGLAEHLRAELRVERARRQHRRAVRGALQACGGGFDVGELQHARS